MIDGLKPHSEYKDSGLPWVGVLPTHWKVERAKGRFKKLNRPIRPEDETVTCFRDGTVTLRKNRRLRGFTEAIYELGYQGIRKGDLVIHAMDAFAGAVGVSDSDGKGSPIYGVCRPIFDDSPYYYAHVVREMSRTQWILALSRGIRERSTDFRFESFARQFVPVPPPDEQAAIVKFLDYANGKIERAIRAKRKLIGLLNEQKQAIIHRAVTRGLDPNVKLKPSGIPWLGDVPEHWTLKRFKYVATINTGQVDPRKPKYRNLILIAPNHIRSGDGYLIEKETAADQGADSGKYMVTSGQIIYSKIRPNLRKATIAPCNCLCSADMYPISPKTSELSTDFLLALLLSQAFTKFAVDSSMRVAMPKVNREALANCILWFPSLNEQTQILEYLGREMAPFDTAIIRTQREIDLLREYRTTLTAEVVTGKLDVRETAKGLPDQADEPLPADELLDDLVDDEIAEEVEA
jgi:type I restriction enzyme S subunit